MYLGYYPDPRNGIEIPKKERVDNPKIAVIMPVYVGPDARVNYHSVNEYGESEPFEEDKLRSIQNSLSCYEKFAPGIPYDLILVDNGTTDEKALEFYKTVKYPMLKRENDGFSFGAYKYAWETFKEKYDYYLFLEADCAPASPNWLSRILDAFNSADDIGIVGNVLETRGVGECNAPFEVVTKQPEWVIWERLKFIGTKRNWMCNLDGTFFFTSSRVLKLVDKHGGLQVRSHKGNISDEALFSSTGNELLFSQPMLELGYKICAYATPTTPVGKIVFFYGSRLRSATEINTDWLVPIVNTNTMQVNQQMKSYYAKIQDYKTSE